VARFFREEGKQQQLQFPGIEHPPPAAPAAAPPALTMAELAMIAIMVAMFVMATPAAVPTLSHLFPYLYLRCF
jgi:hypothetical protein